MEVECLKCGKKVEFKLSDRDTLFSSQNCTVCEVSFTQIVRNLKIVDGKITGEIVREMRGIDLRGVDINKGGEGHGKEEK